MCYKGSNIIENHKVCGIPIIAFWVINAKAAAFHWNVVAFAA